MRFSRWILIALLVVALPSAAAAADINLPIDGFYDSRSDYPDDSRDIWGVGLLQPDSPDSYKKVEFGIFLDAQPKRKAILPSIELDRNGDGKTDRMIGSPRGEGPGVYEVGGSKSKLTKVGKAKVRTDPEPNNTVFWTTATSLILAKGPASKIVCWRGVTYTKSGKRADLAPDKGFNLTKDNVIGDELC